MKFFFSILILFSLISGVCAGEASPLTDPECVSGRIVSYEYRDYRVYVKIKGSNYELYTDRVSSFPFIIKAFKRKLPVEIYTNACYNQGGFAIIRFFN